MEQPLLGRREFLKATTVVGVTGALGLSLSDSLVPRANAAESSVADDAKETKIVKTNCRACIHNCGVLAHVRNGRVIKLEGNPEYPMSKGTLCAKGLSGIQALYNPNRNKYPMLRVGARGENKWKRVSWHDALETLAKKMMETREKYGAETVFCSTGGGGNPEFFSIARFANAFDTPNWFEPGCAQCYLPRNLTYELMYGGLDTSIADSNALEIYDPDPKMKSIVMWGTNVSYSCPAGGGRALVDLRAKGVKTVHIDPRFTPDGARADVWLPVRPGTDVALMMAWIRYIIDKDLYDHDFVMKWTNLPYLVNTKTKMMLHANEKYADVDDKTYMIWDQKSKSAKPMVYPWNDSLRPALEGVFTIDGQEYKTGFQLLKEQVASYSLEYAAEVCWLRKEKIEEAIKIFAEGPSGLCLGVATDQCENSTQAAMCAVILDGLMGNVERPGALIQRRPTSGFSGVPSFITYIVGPAKHLLSESQLKKRLGGTKYKGLLHWWAGHAPSHLDAILTGKPYKPRVWIERSGNKFAMLGNASSWEPAVKQMDFITHMYMYPTSFSAYADLLLPASEWLETNMLVEALNQVFARQAVVHLWETMDETLFWSKLAKHLADMGHENCKRAFDPEFMGADLPYWDSIEDLLDVKIKSTGMKWDEFKDKAPYTFMPYEEWRKYYTYLEKDKETNLPQGFNTPTKKLELYADSFITLGKTGRPWTTYDLPPAPWDYEPLPYYAEPAENPNNDIGKEFPLVMTNGRLPMYHHGTLRNAPWTREMYPVPEIWINPVAAERYGIKQHDWVWVESKRGKTQARALVTEGIAPGTVYMERFWFPEKLNTKTHGWREMNVNILSKNDAPYNDVVGTYTLRGYQVKVTKAESAPDGVWTQPEQYEPWLPDYSDAEPTPEVKGA